VRREMRGGSSESDLAGDGNARRGFAPRVTSRGVVGEWMSARPSPTRVNGAADEDEAPSESSLL
jgi:hypothetical protein